MIEILKVISLIIVCIFGSGLLLYYSLDLYLKGFDKLLNLIKVKKLFWQFIVEQYNKKKI